MVLQGQGWGEAAEGHTDRLGQRDRGTGQVFGRSLGSCLISPNIPTVFVLVVCDGQLAALETPLAARQGKRGKAL